MATRTRDNRRGPKNGSAVTITRAVAGPATRPWERQPTDDEIRVLAYQKWVAAGMPPGDGVSFWLEAEQELRQSWPLLT